MFGPAAQDEGPRIYVQGFEDIGELPNVVSGDGTTRLAPGTISIRSWEATCSACTVKSLVRSRLENLERDLRANIRRLGCGTLQFRPPPSWWPAFGVA